MACLITIEHKCDERMETAIFSSVPLEWKRAAKIHFVYRCLCYLMEINLGGGD